MVSATRHEANLFAAIVGSTGKARKGLALDLSRAIFQQAAPDFLPKVKKGVSTGEGIINLLADADPDSGMENAPVELEYDDKRVLLVESEMSGILEKMKRQGNSLSATLRQCFDGGSIETLTKTAAQKVTRPHVALITHITPRELRDEFKTVEMANGLGNRFLWIATERARSVPNPPVYEPSPLLTGKVRAALEHAEAIKLMERSEAANRLWANSLYPELTQDESGLVGDMLGRGDAITLRLSMIFALMRGSSSIEVDDLESAMDITRYSQRGVRWLFESSSFDPREQRIIEALLAAPGRTMPRTHIRKDVFSNNIVTSDLDGIKQHLMEQAIIGVEKYPTGGADVERWTLLSPTQ